jgi:aminopeptidase N
LIARAARTVAQTLTRVCASSLFIFAALAWLAPPAHARDDYPRQGWIDATDYTISLTIPEAGDEIRAETTIAFKLKSNDPRDLPLDFGSLTVDGVTVNERATGFKHEGERLLVSLASGYKNGDILRVSVKYHGRPSDGLFFKRNKFGDRTIFADNWPNRAHHWFPCIDHPYDKAKVTFVVTAPARYGVVANGSLHNTSAGPNGTRTAVWRESIDIPVYCMVIGVTEFSVVRRGVWTVSASLTTSTRKTATRAYTITGERSVPRSISGASSAHIHTRSSRSSSRPHASAGWRTLQASSSTRMPTTARASSKARSRTR